MDQGVGHEIKRLREDRGWSQAKLAVEADMSVSGVSMIENGQRNLTTTTLAKLAGAFELEIADLFPKAQGPLPLLDSSAGERAPAFEALGRYLASNWKDELEEWEEKISPGESLALFEFGRLLEWVVGIMGTRAMYKAVANDAYDPPRAELQDTLRVLEEAEQSAKQTFFRVYEPAKTYAEFRKIVEASELEMISSNVEQDG